MIPDARSGARLRATVLVLYVTCCAITCTRAGEPARTGRIVSIGGPVTEIVFALGHGDRVVAVDTSSVYPAAVTSLPQVGYQRTLSAEAVLAVSPDLVIASADAGPPAALDQIRAAGVRIEIIPAASTVEQAAARIEAVGGVLHEPARASRAAAQLRVDASAARKRCCAGEHRVSKAVLVYARGAGTVLLAGTGTPAAAMLELAGARNAVTGFAGFKPISAEALVAAAPEAIVIPARGLASIGGETGLLALPGVADTPAGRAHRIVAVDDLLLLGFGPRLPAAIDELARGLGGLE
jgi:iron complex transport system substrate-binding protein